MRPVINTRVLYTFFSALVIIVGSVVTIHYAQSHSFTSKASGLLVANSFPSGGQIYVNDKLVGATDNTIYLDPGNYSVEIRRDGYTPWKKNLKIERELVTQTNAQLFRRVASLTPLTYAGAKNISPSPDGQKILFYTASASAQIANGIYVLDLNNNFLLGPREARQIAEETPGFTLSAATFIWSPDSSQAIMSVPEHEVLLNLSQKNTLNLLPDIGFKKKQLLSDWEAEAAQREQQYLGRFPIEVQVIATQSAKNVYLSPDKKKIMFTATQAVQLPENLVPPVPATNTQPEERMLRAGQTYIYDREEDKNFLITPTSNPVTGIDRISLLSPNATTNNSIASVLGFASQSAQMRLQATSSAQTALNFQSYYSPAYSTGVQWYPDSRHVIFTNKDIIEIEEYDNTNKTMLYQGPFAEHFIYPWPDGSKVLILTSFGANLPANIYAIDVK